MKKNLIVDCFAGGGRCLRWHRDGTGAAGRYSDQPRPGRHPDAQNQPPEHTASDGGYLQGQLAEIRQGSASSVDVG